MFTLLTRLSDAAFSDVRIKCGKFIGKIYFTNHSRMYHSADYLYIAFPDEPIYLRRGQVSDNKTENKLTGTVSKYFDKFTTMFLAFPRLTPDLEFTSVYLSSAVKAQHLYRQSIEWKGLNFAHSLQFSGNLFLPPRDHLNRGVCAYLETGDEVEISLVENIRSFAEKHDFVVSKITKKDSDMISITHDNQNGEIQEEIYSIVYRQDIPRTAESNTELRLGGNESPIFTIPEVSPVYHSYGEAVNVLQKCAHMPEVTELLYITHKHVAKDFLTSVWKGTTGPLPHPFVIVEGMDGTGKTTLTQLLEEKLSAARYFTPPPPIQHLRPFFDRLPEIMRRAYYSLGNYIVAGQIFTECQSRPVIMDRFWHSTTAYGIANETSTGDLPVAGSYVYTWPQDLLRPTLVLFMTVTEEVRKQRLCGRGLASTFEEKSLDKDQLFRYRLCESYRRMDSPSCVEIDACGTVEEVFTASTDILKHHGIDMARQ